MNSHWTTLSTEDFMFRIAADFISQLEDKMEVLQLTQDELAKKLGRSKGRISQVFNNPGNITLKKAVEYSNALNMKVAIVAYEDTDDPSGERGPVNSEIFKICWEKYGKPHDFWALEKQNEKLAVDADKYLVSVLTEAANREVIIRAEEIKETSGLLLNSPAAAFA